MYHHYCFFFLTYKKSPSPKYTGVSGVYEIYVNKYKDLRTVQIIKNTQIVIGCMP